MSQTAKNQNSIYQSASDLDTIVELLRDNFASKGDVALYTDLAARLSRLAGQSHSKPWSWRYVQSVHHNTLGHAPSKRFAHAVSLLAAAIDGVPPEFVDAREVQVMADPAKVQAGSLVLGQSKQCDEPGCTIQFVPVVPWQKYCPAHRDPRSRK